MTWIPGGTFAMGSAGLDGAVYAARQAEAVDTATCHLGFRCVVRGDAPPGR